MNRHEEDQVFAEKFRSSERAHFLRQVLKEILDDPKYKSSMKAIFFEVHEDWLDKKWAEFGKWSFRGLCAALFAGATTIYMLGRSKGWW